MSPHKLFWTALLIMLNVACSQSDDAVAPATEATLSADINGQSFTTGSAVSTYEKATKRLTVTGSTDAHQVGFTLVDFSGASAITLEDRLSNKSTGSYVDVKKNTMYTIQGGRTGTVTVTRFSGNVIEGTFSLKTYNSGDKTEVVVSNGQFKMPVENL